MKIRKLNKLETICMQEAINKCFDELCAKPYTHKYSHIKSRKVKEARRHVIKHMLYLTGTSKICYITDDYYYWIARNTHKLLYPNTEDTFYLEQL